MRQTLQSLALERFDFIFSSSLYDRGGGTSVPAVPFSLTFETAREPRLDLGAISYRLRGHRRESSMGNEISLGSEDKFNFDKSSGKPPASPVRHSNRVPSHSPLSLRLRFSHRDLFSLRSKDSGRGIDGGRDESRLIQLNAHWQSISLLGTE